MNNKKNLNVIIIAAAVMLVAFFLLPLFSPRGSESEMGLLSLVLEKMPTTMIAALFKGSMGSMLCLLLMLFAPVYLLLQAYQDRLPIPKTAFPLPIGMAALVPLVLAVFFGTYLDGSFMGGGEPENEMETMRSMAFFMAAVKVGWAYYLYLAAAVVLVWMGISYDNGSQPKSLQKNWAIAAAALLLIIVANSQMALFSTDRHSIFGEGQLTINSMMMGFGWLFTIVCLYIVVSAFRETKMMEGFRKYLLPVKVSAIVVAIVAVLVLILCIGFASTGDAMRGPASLSALIIAVGMVLLAFTPTGDSPVQESAVTKKKENRPSWLMANKKQVGIGLGILVVVFLLFMLLKSCGSSSSAVDEDIELVDEEEIMLEEESEDELSQTFVLDKGKLGPIEIGMSYTDLPSAVEELYNRFEYKSVTHEDDMDGEWTEEYLQFYKDNKEVFTTGVIGKKITSFTLLGNASYIRTADGFFVGYNAREFFQSTKLDWETYYMGEAFASMNGYTYYVNSDDLTTDVPAKVSDFKANATLSKIVYN